MILLDTNVVSEAMRPDPAPRLMAWLNAQAAETLYVSSVTAAELLYGIAALPAGRRRSGLERVLADLLELFKDRIIPFDLEAAQQYAQRAVSARRKGRGFPLPDGYIAAIAASQGFAVASRDTAPYLAAGLAVINPWQEA